MYKSYVQDYDIFNDRLIALRAQSEELEELVNTFYRT